MQYTQAKPGRIFIIKFSDHDDVIESLQQFVQKEKIKTAVIHFMGALRQASLVTGPKKPVIPPEPQWEQIRDGWETMGLGTIFSDAKGAHIHLHGSMGRKKLTKMGCLRKNVKTYLVMEAIVMELTHTNARKEVDAASRLALLHIPNSPTRGRKKCV